MADQTLGGGPVEQARGVVEAADQPAVGLCGKLDGEVEPGDGVAQVQESAVQAGESGLRWDLVDEIEHDAEQRGAGQVARPPESLGHQVQRHLAVDERVQGTSPSALHEVGENGIALDIRPEHEGVLQVAEHALIIGAHTGGDRAADDDVVLTAVTGQHHLERGEQDHEQRGVQLRGDLAQRFGHADVELEADLVADPAPRRRPRAVGGQFQRLDPV